MKLTALEQKLIAAARAVIPSEQVPYCFEKRIMARLEDAAPLSVAALWSRALWRAALSCVVVTLIFGAAWALGPGSNSSSTDFSQDFESAVLVMADQPSDSW